MAKGRKMPEYDTYVKAYLKKENQLAQKGYSMTDTIYSKADYEWMYKNTLKQQQEEVKRGERSRTGMIIRDMVNDQAYRISKKQARAQQQAGKGLGIKRSIQKYMMEDTDFQEKLNERAGELYMEGRTGKEVQLIIGQEYFGSE